MKQLSKIMLAAVATIAFVMPAMAWDFGASGSAFSRWRHTTSNTGVAGVTSTCFHVAEDDPLALKSQANAGAASATEATAANIILLNFFITLLKML